jgi:hypothetical protein
VDRGGAVMNNMEIEFVFLARKIWGTERDEDDEYKGPEDAIEKQGGIISIGDEYGDLIYRMKSGSSLSISYSRYLKDTLIRDGDIAPVVRTDGRIDFAATVEDAKIERARVDDYLAKLRVKIAAGEITI